MRLHCRHCPTGPRCRRPCKHSSRPVLMTTTLHRCNSSAARWHALAHRSTPLRIAVLNRPTAGCGSAEAVDHGHNTTLSTRCDYTRSWARRVRDCVQPALDSWLPAREVVFKVGFKNAVSLAFFGECASGRLLGPHTDLILLEATNVWNTDVAFLIRRLRRAAPAAHIVFVTWPARSILDLAVRSLRTCVAPTRLRWRPRRGSRRVRRDRAPRAHVARVAPRQGCARPRPGQLVLRAAREGPRAPVAQGPRATRHLCCPHHRERAAREACRRRSVAERGDGGAARRGREGRCAAAAWPAGSSRFDEADALPVEARARWAARRGRAAARACARWGGCRASSIRRCGSARCRRSRDATRRPHACRRRRRRRRQDQRRSRRHHRRAARWRLCASGI